MRGPVIQTECTLREHARLVGKMPGLGARKPGVRADPRHIGTDCSVCSHRQEMSLNKRVFSGGVAV